MILAGIWTQYVLGVLRDTHGLANLPGYMAFNAPRVLMLPTVLVWLLALLPAGAAFAPTEPAPATNPDEAHSPDPDRFPRVVGREDQLQPGDEAD